MSDLTGIVFPNEKFEIMQEAMKELQEKLNPPIFSDALSDALERMRESQRVLLTAPFLELNERIKASNEILRSSMAEAMNFIPRSFLQINESLKETIILACQSLQSVASAEYSFDDAEDDYQTISSELEKNPDYAEEYITENHREHLISSIEYVGDTVLKDDEEAKTTFVSGFLKVLDENRLKIKDWLAIFYYILQIVLSFVSDGGPNPPAVPPTSTQ